MEIYTPAFWHKHMLIHLDEIGTQQHTDIDTVDYALFHYTRIQGIIGILESRSIYATDFRFLEDRMERRALDSILSDLGKKYPHKDFQRLLNVSSEFSDSRLFVASFTILRNDHNHWANYAGMDGFAIEIDRSHLKKIVSEGIHKFPAYMGWCLYGKNTHREAIDWVLRGFSDMVARGIANSANDRYWKDLVRALHSVLNIIRSEAKTAKFLPEREARIAIQPHPSQSASLNRSVENFQRNSDNVPFLRIPVGRSTAENEIFARRVLVGPTVSHSDFSTVERAIKLNCPNVLLERVALPGE